MLYDMQITDYLKRKTVLIFIRSQRSEVSLQQDDVNRTSICLPVFFSHCSHIRSVSCLFCIVINFASSLPVPKLDIGRQLYVPEMWVLIWAAYTFLSTTGVTYSSFENTYLDFLKIFVVIFYMSLILIFVCCRHKCIF